MVESRDPYLSRSYNITVDAALNNVSYDVVVVVY
jgi:hypothetical protein